MNWYRTSDLDEASRLVRFDISGQTVTGFVWFTKAGKPRFRIGTLRQWEELPSGVVPDLWQPIGAWPYPLPEPVRVQPEVDWQSPPEPHSEPEKPLPEGGWPYPNLRLGRAHEPPASPQEAEARILRFLRTAAVLEHEPVIRECAWPKDLMIAANVVAKSLHASRNRKLAHLHQSDYDDFDIDRTDVRPLPAQWEPSPRDCSEYDLGKILKWIPDGTGSLFAWRAARPPYSFFQISRFLRIPEAEVKQRYAEACEAAYRSAQR